MPPTRCGAFKVTAWSDPEHMQNQALPLASCGNANPNPLWLGESQQVKRSGSPCVSPRSSLARSRWGELTCREACKPLLSMCSKVICQLSCSGRQSLGRDSAYSATSSLFPQPDLGAAPPLLCLPLSLLLFCLVIFPVLLSFVLILIHKY